VAVLVAGVATVTASHLESGAVVAWNAYIAEIQSRMSRDLSSRAPFLEVDRPADQNDRRDVLNGSFVVRPVEDDEGAMRAIEDAGALAHHWRGSVFVPQASLKAVLDVLSQAPAAGPDLDVLRAAVIGRKSDGLTIYLRLQKRGFVKAVFDTEHDVTIVQWDAERATSRSIATRIVEVIDSGTSTEHPAQVGEDHGFLYRLNVYWRYESVPGGVLAECESVSLSRGIPFGLGYVARPLIERAARESMVRTLDTFRSTVAASTRARQP
jgi:hypothetical protein